MSSTGQTSSVMAPDPDPPRAAVLAALRASGQAPDGLSVYTGPLAPRRVEIIVEPGECVRLTAARDLLAWWRKHKQQHQHRSTGTA